MGVGGGGWGRVDFREYAGRPTLEFPEVAGQVNLGQGGAYPLFITEKFLESLGVAVSLDCEERPGSPVRPRPCLVPHPRGL